MDFHLHPKQSFAFNSKATEILYGGAAGGGKSHLMRVKAIALCTAIPNLQVYLFRRTSVDLVLNHMASANGFPAMLADWLASGWVKYNGSERKFYFWNGSTIHLCHCEHEKNRFNYQGAEIHVLLIDELTHFTEVIYRFLRGRTRLFLSRLCGGEPASTLTIKILQFLSRLCGGERWGRRHIQVAMFSKPPMRR